MRKLILWSIVMAILYTSFFAIDNYCYLAKGISMFNYKMYPFNTFGTRLRGDHDSTGPYYFSKETDMGYCLKTNLEFQSMEDSSIMVYKEPTTISRINGDTIIYIQCITQYGYNKEQLVVYCETDQGEEYVIKPIRKGLQYVNILVNANDICNGEYKWIDLFDFKSYVLPCIWMALCIVIPFATLAYIVGLLIFVFKRNRDNIAVSI